MTELLKDDLRAIKGVGPKIEKQLHELGIHSYKDMLDLGSDRFPDADDAIANLQTRIERDRWLEQARELHEKKYDEVV